MFLVHIEHFHSWLIDSSLLKIVLSWFIKKRGLPIIQFLSRLGLSRVKALTRLLISWLVLCYSSLRWILIDVAFQFRVSLRNLYSEDKIIMLKENLYRLILLNLALEAVITHLFFSLLLSSRLSLLVCCSLWARKSSLPLYL